MAGPDFNQQLFASGQMPGALGAHGGGQSADSKKSSLPLLATLGAKDAGGWVDIFNAPGLLPGGTNGIGGIFTPKSGDKFLQAFQNTGSGNATSGIGESLHFQGMVARSRDDSGERGV
ncbi:MAG: hypothetical protein JO166_10350 [Deltaproteobacteria bacterium]|nr:hypothetical protein [Deltaproteobacteria bacterium]